MEAYRVADTVITLSKSTEHQALTYSALHVHYIVLANLALPVLLLFFVSIDKDLGPAHALCRFTNMGFKDPEMALVVLSGAHDIGHSRANDKFVCNSTVGFSAGGLGSRGLVRVIGGGAWGARSKK